MSTVELLLGLLLVSAALGLAACIRKGAGKASWALGAAIVCTAAAGVWRYTYVRSTSARIEERMRREMAEFSAVRPTRLVAGTPVRAALTWRVPCRALSAPVCGEKGEIRAHARSEIKARLSGSIRIGLTPSQRMPQPGEGAFLQYALHVDDVELVLKADSQNDGVLITADGEASPDGEMTEPPRFMAAEAAEVRVQWSQGCAEGECDLTAIRLNVAGQWFCTSDIRSRRSDRSFVGYLTRCSVH